MSLLARQIATASAIPQLLPSDSSLGSKQPFPLLIDPPDTFERWKDLAARYAVSGVQVHDARLVAVAQANGIQNILTFNGRDFGRYSDLGIRALDPIEIGK